jgi:alpha-amylase/alpha-mannosidase (GH57 family)
MTAARRSVVVHGHFYQPPREDPWTDEVPREISAAPLHDWNQRIHDECYRAVVAAHVLDAAGRIAAVVNTLEWISWDAGPTLLRWMARETPDTYRAFLEGDARSAARLGHGNAMASPYHHLILPLATPKDRVTEVRWGIADFRRRFGREPEGMWLPEAAVDTETLEVLAGAGIAFTVLGPGQVSAVPRDGLPGRVRLPSGRAIAVFVYDGALSHEVAFGDLLLDAGAWVRRMAADPGGRRLVALATDGETFGHHRRWGDMALAAAVSVMRDHPAVRTDNFASFLSHNPPVEDIEIVEPSSWSCVHGVERWRADCGCRVDTTKPKAQAWRAVLRDALDELATSLHALFEGDAGLFFADPWAGRDAYGTVLDQGVAAVRRFVDEHATRMLTDEEAGRVLDLLEMERHALSMFTSCGWFFDDLAGLEPLQVLRYAARAIDLARAPGAAWEERLRERLAHAASVDPGKGDGRKLWDTEVRGAPRALVAPDADAGEVGRTAGGRRREAHPGSTAPGDAPSADAAPPPPHRAAGALVAAVERFLREPTDDAAARVLAAADAADAAGIAVPFEAQAQLGRELASLRAAAPEATRSVALRLGFAEAALEAAPATAGAPVGFVFGLHVHQPVGNFDAVVRSHVDDVYVPLLRRLAERDALPVALHVSGPLLEWLDANAHPWLDEVAALAEAGSTELLLSGFYEPVLPALSRSDRAQQIAWMKEWLRSRLGVDAKGLWLTERVWEPSLAEDLADAGVRYVMVDDRHFLVTGYEPHELHRPFRTESSGKGVSILPISERLRYLIPFRPPEEFADHLRALQAEAQPLAVLADDGEKFGGWPGTAEWVWQRGWMDRFLDTLEGLRNERVLRLLSPSQALHDVPAHGPAYLPTASYREMEAWSLPAAGALRLERLERALENGLQGVDGGASRSLLRGGHWKNFLARYSESNRMHKKAAALSDLCRRHGDPPEARRALGRAQCNDAYWHGVFGGLYLRHLRNAVWANLARAEGLLRRGEGLGVDVGDLDEDGADEVWIHSQAFSAQVAPSRGGTLVELTDLRRHVNLADTLTRRREAYHRAEPKGGAPPSGGGARGGAVDAPTGTPEAAEATTVGPDAGGDATAGTAVAPGVEAGSLSAGGDGGMPSIHALEEGLRFDALPPFDREDRAIFVDRVLPAGLRPDAYARGDYEPLRSWASERMVHAVTREDGGVTVALSAPGDGVLTKSITFAEDGTVTVAYRWDASAFPPDARFAPELSFMPDAVPELELSPPPEATWRYEIRTVSKSERGSEESVQGVSVTPLWRCAVGEARVRMARATTPLHLAGHDEQGP